MTLKKGSARYAKYQTDFQAESFTLPEQLRIAFDKTESDDPRRRIEGIDEIAKMETQSAARLLIEIYQLVGWRSTKYYILKKLTHFLHFDRVFFELSKSLSHIDDTQMAIWVIECFKYSKINRFDRYLANVYYQANDILKEKILDALIYLGSPFAPGLIKKLLRKYGTDERLLVGKSKAKVGELPVNVQILLTNYIGTFVLLDARDLLFEIAAQLDPALHSYAIINLLKLGVNAESIERELHGSGIAHSGADAYLKDHIIELYDERQLLKKSATVEGRIDAIFNTPVEDVDNKAILALKEFGEKGFFEKIRPYDQEEHLEMILRIMTVLQLDTQFCRTYVESEISHFTQQQSLAMACSFLWLYTNADNRAVFKAVLKRLEELQGKKKYRIEPVFFDYLSLPDDTEEIIRTFEDMILEGQLSENSIINCINLLVREHHGLFPNKAVRISIEVFLNRLFEHYMVTDMQRNHALILRLVRAFGQINFPSVSFYRYVGRVLDNKELTVTELNGIIRTLINTNNDERSHEIALDILGRLRLVKSRDDEGGGWIKGNWATQKLLIWCFMTDKRAVPEQFVETLITSVYKINRQAMLHLLFVQGAKIAQPWLERLARGDTKLSYGEKAWLIKCLGKFGGPFSINYLANLTRNGEDTLRRLAAFSLARMREDGAIFESLKIASEVIRQGKDSDIAMTMFRKLHIPKTKKLRTMQMVSHMVDLIQDEKLYDACMDFLSSLKTNSLQEETNYTGLKFTKVTEKITARLASEISSFDLLHPLIQSVLMSAEIPLNYPDIYDRAVDKSSSILQYFKAVDIYLEQKLGAQLLTEENKELFQNIILENGIDKILKVNLAAPEISTEELFDNFLELIEFEGQISQRGVSLVKFKEIIEAALNEKLFHPEFRIIDGLKAWAVLIILGGRRFGANPIDPVFTVNPGNEERLPRVCRNLISLQDIRNPIAHRKTIFDMTHVEKVRTITTYLFNDLQLMFNQPDQQSNA